MQQSKKPVGKWSWSSERRGGYGRARPSGGVMPPHLGLAVGSEEGSIPSPHSGAQYRAQLTAQEASGTTMRSDVAPITRIRGRFSRRIT